MKEGGNGVSPRFVVTWEGMLIENGLFSPHRNDSESPNLES